MGGWPSFERIRQKLDHAKLHLDTLNAESRRYVDDNPGKFVPNTESDSNNPTFLYHQTVPIPSKINLLAGDCLQNIRSAFDYLVWELVAVAGNKPTKKNMFPICLTESSFKEAKRGKRLEGISMQAEALIQQLQPYTHTDPSEHWLAILDELVNINKHRRIYMATLNAFSVSRLLNDLGGPSGWEDSQSVVHDTTGKSIFTAEEVQMQGDLAALIAFDEGAVNGMKGLDIRIAVETFIGLTTEALKPFEVLFT